MDPRRARALGPDRSPGTGPVAYWMSRDQRARDNWALIHAAELARSRRVDLVVVFALCEQFLGAGRRQFAFMLRGLEQTSRLLAERGIPFFLVRGDPAAALVQFVEDHGIGEVVTDFDPLRIKRGWTEEVAESIGVPLVEVDAHNVVPCRIVSDKREFGAYTLRPRIARVLPDWLVPFPPFDRISMKSRIETPAIDWAGLLRDPPGDPAIPEVDWLEPGEAAARRALDLFVRTRLESYPEASRDPTAGALSDLSPYLHFGQLAAQRAALAVASADAPEVARHTFFEQLVVRRELSDNFCWYTPDYDRVTCFPAWARATLDAHRTDRRSPTYTAHELETASTHDTLWNAAQLEMTLRGKMHGYLRMYWAKKILEWTGSPEEAMAVALELNDRWELDGRDPNGYAGVAWSLGGVHDRPWGERAVFGKIRYMSLKGCRSKFDVDAYVGAVEELRARDRSAVRPGRRSPVTGAGSSGSGPRRPARSRSTGGRARR